MGDRLRVGGEVSREKMALQGTDPESYITEYTLVYGGNTVGSTTLYSRRCSINVPCHGRLPPGYSNSILENCALQRGFEGVLREILL